MTNRHATSEMPERIGLREVMRLAWPITVSMLSYTVMLVVDTIFVGQLGTAPLAAVGLATSVTYVFLCFGMGAVRGMKVVVAQRTGAGDTDSVQRALSQGLWLALAIGAFTAACAAVAGHVFGLLGATEEVASLANEYLSVRLVCAPIGLTLLALNCWYEGRGDTRTPMVATVMANALNIALDPIFIFGLGPIPAMGLGGAALATELAVAIALVWQASRTWRNHRQAATPAWIERDLFAEIVRMGLPMGIRGALEVTAWAVFVGLLARIGADELAAHVVVIRIVSVSFLPGHAIAEAASVLVGQAVGAKRPELATQAWKVSTWLALGLMGACGVVFFAAPEPLIAVFGASEGVVAVARDLLFIAAAFQLVDALAMVAQGALNGAGQTRFVMVTSVTVAWIGNLPLAWLLAIELELGAVGAWLALTLEIAAIAAISVHRIVRGRAWSSEEGRARRPGARLALATSS